MRADGIFVDTSILLYAHDLSEPVKNQKAQGVVESLWLNPDRVWLSVQVLQELYVNLAKMVSPEEAEDVTRDFMRLNVVVNDQSLLMEALEARRTHQVSFWDALILSAAIRAGAGTLMSEDFTHERSYGTIKVINPFLQQDEGGVDAVL